MLHNDPPVAFSKELPSGERRSFTRTLLFQKLYFSDTGFETTLAVKFNEACKDFLAAVSLDLIFVLYVLIRRDNSRQKIVAA